MVISGCCVHSVQPRRSPRNRVLSRRSGVTPPGAEGAGVDPDAQIMPLHDEVSEEQPATTGLEPQGETAGPTLKNDPGFGTVAHQVAPSLVDTTRYDSKIVTMADGVAAKPLRSLAVAVNLPAAPPLAYLPRGMHHACHHMSDEVIAHYNAAEGPPPPAMPYTWEGAAAASLAHATANVANLQPGLCSANVLDSQLGLPPQLGMAQGSQPGHTPKALHTSEVACTMQHTARIVAPDNSWIAGHTTDPALPATMPTGFTSASASGIPITATPPTIQVHVIQPAMRGAETAGLPNQICPKDLSIGSTSNVNGHAPASSGLPEGMLTKVDGVVSQTAILLLDGQQGFTSTQPESIKGDLLSFTGQSVEAEDKLDELRLLFPDLDEDVRQSVFELLGGNLCEAKCVLQQMQEEENEKCAQLVADQALARQLQSAEEGNQSDGSDGSSLYEGFTSDCTGSPPSPFSWLNVASSPSSPDSSASPSPGDSPPSSPNATQGSAGSGTQGLPLLEAMFAPAVNRDLLADVLEANGGDIDAACMALRDMGLPEPSRPLRPQPGVTQRGPSALHTGGPWVNTFIPIKNKYRALAAADVADEWTAEQGAGAVGRTGGVAAATAAAGSRPMGQCVAKDGAIAANDAIHMLAAIGVDFMGMGLSKDALECICVACNVAGVRGVLGKPAETQDKAWKGRMRNGGRGLTHQEKQDVYRREHQLLKALVAVRKNLQAGSRAAYQDGAPSSKRLARELKEAALALGPAIADLDAAAAAGTFRGMNAAQRNAWSTDLHGLHARQAAALLDEQLARFMHGHVDWLLITGRGLHSRGDPTLAPAVDEWLRRRGLAADAEQHRDGRLVRLTPEVFARLEGHGGVAGAAA